MLPTGYTEGVFNRPPRVYRTWRVETIELDAPPDEPTRSDQSGWAVLLMPLVGVVLLAIVTTALSSGGSILAFVAPMGVMTMVGIATTLMSQRAQTRKAAIAYAERRAFYEAARLQAEQRIHTLYAEEQTVRREHHPDLLTLLRIAGALGDDAVPHSRLWERRVTDPDALTFSVGQGQVPFSSSIIVPQAKPDGAVDARLAEVAQQYRMLEDVPITIPLREVGTLGIAGPRAASLALLRAVIWQATVFHAPTELRIAAVYPEAAAAEWKWLRWLPHTIPLSNDPHPSVRMHASDPDAVSQLLSSLLDQLSRRREQPDQPRGTVFAPIILLVDGVKKVRNQPAISEILRFGAHYGIYALFLVDSWDDIPDACGAMLDLGGDGPRWACAVQHWSPPFRVDCGIATEKRSDGLARRLAAVRLAETGSSQDIPRSVRLFDLLGVRDERDLLPPKQWATPPQRAWHPDVPIGQKAGKQPLVIDLYEHVHGSHGIIAGATGAGKSVLLQCLIAALAVKHSPLQLQLLLIDFKAGASLSMLAQLPHTVGFVTDLEGRLAERAMVAIKSEIRRRKTLFRAAEVQLNSQIENITDYRAKAAHLEPLPNLLIVIDEFDEMVQSYREFVAELVRVVKQGRSLGVHLLIASQQPGKAVTDDIRTQLKYFIALRLGSSEDSREMLLKPDAHFLPTDVPGRAYFRVGADSTLFQVAQITGAYYPAGEAEQRERPEDLFELIDDTALGEPLAKPVPRGKGDEARETDLDVLVRTLKQAGTELLRQQEARTGWRPRPIWQPPLPSRLTLAAVLPDDAVATISALPQATRARGQGRPWLQPVIGRLDLPQESRQEALRIHLADAHLAVVGASGSGKTTLLRTLLLSLALEHAPDELWYYAVDAGGQGLSLLADLPHTGGLVQARDRERIRRLLSMIEREIARRQELFRSAGASDLAALNHQRSEPLPAWVVVIDKLALLREEFKDKHGYETVTEDLVRLARISRSYGIHFVITADSARDLTYPLLSLIDGRIALRLPDLVDYTDVLGTRAAAQIPANSSGRGLCVRQDHGILELQVALPLLEQREQTLDDDQASVTDSELNAELRATVARVRAAWEHHNPTIRPTPVELLPALLTRQQIEDLAPAPLSPIQALAVPIGKEALDLATCELVFDAITPHQLVVGGRRSGKTTLLRSLLVGLAARYSPAELRLVIIDGPRRAMRALRELPQVDAYASSESEVAALVPLLEQLRDRQMDGQRWLIVVDDYDLGHKGMASQFQTAYDGTNFHGVLKALAAVGGEGGVHLLIAANVAFPEAAGEVVRALDAGRSGLILWPNKYDSGTRLLDMALPVGEREAEQPPGRALLVREDERALVQVALVPDDALGNAVAALVEQYGTLDDEEAWGAAGDDDAAPAVELMQRNGVKGGRR